MFETAEKLKDIELLCLESFDLNETMSAFEVMDPKMDVRKARNESLWPKKAIEQGILIVDRPLSEKETASLLDETLIQLATWQKEIA